MAWGGRQQSSEGPLKKLVLIAALGAVLGGCSAAQNTPQADSGLAPRDPPFGKGLASNDTMHLPSGSGTSQSYGRSSYQIPPRDPPFGKGLASNDTMHLPSGDDASQSYSQSSDPIPPRDPPFGKGM